MTSMEEFLPLDGDPHGDYGLTVTVALMESGLPFSITGFRSESFEVVLELSKYKSSNSGELITILRTFLFVEFYLRVLSLFVEFFLRASSSFLLNRVRTFAKRLESHNKNSF